MSEGVNTTGEPGAKDPRDSFDPQAASDYDVMVDWGARLDREMPFFRALFDEAHVERLVDLGCGTAKHAIEFVRWGIDVIGVDPSEPMLAQARSNAEVAHVELDLRVGGFGDVADTVDVPVDAVVCLGNAFIHVDGMTGAREALADMASVLGDDGVLVLHFLNHDRLWKKRPRTMPVRWRETPEGDRVFVRLIGYGDASIDHEFISLEREPGGEWRVESRLSSHPLLLVSDVVEALGETGFSRVEVFGGHDRHAFEPLEDESAIIVAYRR